MKNSLLNLSNSFHDTHTTIFGRPGDILPPATVARVKRRLCPGADCTCSDVLGRRGPQPPNDGMVDGARIDYADLADGRVEIIVVDPLEVAVSDLWADLHICYKEWDIDLYRCKPIVGHRLQEFGSAAVLAEIERQRKT